MAKLSWVNRLNGGERLALASSIVLITITFVVWAGDLALMTEITKEDGVIENLTALFFLLSSAFCSYRLLFWPKTPQRKFLALWAILSFLFLGEETSWFQRILDVPTPEYIQDLNVQEELNIHNLKWFVSDGGLRAALTGEGDNIVSALFSSNNLFRMGYFTYFFILPVLAYSKKYPAIEQKLNYPTPSVGFFVSVWTTILFSLVLFLFSSGIRSVIVLTETREMVFAAFIFIYTLTHLGKKERRTSLR